MSSLADVLARPPVYAQNTNTMRTLDAYSQALMGNNLMADEPPFPNRWHVWGDVGNQEVYNSLTIPLVDEAEYQGQLPLDMQPQIEKPKPWLGG